MSDTITDLAGKTDISPDQAEKGLGAVLGFLQDKLPTDTFSQVRAAVPGSDGMMAAAESDQESSGGGVLGAVTAMVGKLFGGSGTELVSKLSGLGFSAEQVTSFLPNVLEFLKARLPEGLMSKVSGLLPGPKEAEE